MLQCVDGKLTVFRQRFAVIQLLQFVQSSDAERSGSSLQQRFDLVVDAQMTAVEAAFAVCQRVGGGTHFAQVRIGTDVKLTNQFQIVVQHFIERFAFLFCFCVNHRKMQADSTDIESAYENRFVVFVSRFHAAPFKPRGQERTAAHGADDSAIFFIHIRYIAFAGKGKPVGIHGLGGAEDACFKDIFQFLAFAMEIFVIKEYQFGEQYRLFAVFLALPFSADVEHGDGCHFGKFACACAECHGDERIIPAAGSNGVEFVFPALEALFKVVEDVCHGFFVRSLGCQTHVDVTAVEFFIALFREGFQQQVYGRYCKTAVLLAGSGKNDVADDVKGNVQCLGFVVPQVAHFKTAGQNAFYVEQAAVHGVTSGRHIMDVDITVTARLKFFCGHEEFLVQFFVQLIEYQRAFCGNQSAVGVAVFFVTDVHDGLAFFVNFVQHFDKVLFVVAVITVAFCNFRLYLFQCAFYNVVHFRNGDAFFAKGFRFCFHEITDEIQFFLCEFHQGAVSGFVYGNYDFLHIPRFVGIIFLNHIHDDILLHSRQARYNT